MNLKNKQKGITLVALVVTIVILLILAGISIASLTGNGVFEKAKLAKEQQENAQIEENEILEDYESKIGKYILGNREDLASLTPGTASEKDIANGKIAWVNGKQITGTANIMKPYVFGGIIVDSASYAIATSTDESYFTVQGSESNYLMINVLKNMKVKIILHAVERGSLVNRTIAINNSIVETVVLYNNKGEYEYNVSNGDVIKITQLGNSVKSLSILVMCIEEL